MLIFHLNILMLNLLKIISTIYICASLLSPNLVVKDDTKYYMEAIHK